MIGIGNFLGAVICLSFSNSDKGSLLISIEDNAEKILTVWDWQTAETGLKLLETKCSIDPIIVVEVNPLDKNQIIIAGKLLTFLTYNSSCLSKKICNFDPRDKPKYITCITFSQRGDVITGDTNGNIAIFDRTTGNLMRTLKKVHDGSVFTLCALRNGKFISGGGKDGKIILFQENLSSVDSVYSIEPHFGGIRIVVQGIDDKLFLGTTRNCILEGYFESHFTPLVMGHVGEINALSIGSKIGQFITGGMDRLLQLWDPLTHTVVWSKDIGEDIHCCDISPVDGKTVIVGVEKGRWLVFNTDTRELQSQCDDFSGTITVAKFSPSGQYVAIGSREGSIVIYEIIKHGKQISRIGKCAGHTGSILAIDWSTDEQYIRSNSTSIELLHCKYNLFNLNFLKSKVRSFKVFIIFI